MYNTFGRFVKDPQAKLDYGVDWSAWLAGDMITASTWATDAGLSIEANSFTSTVTTVWVSGGTVGTSYKVTNHVTTQGGRENEYSIVIVVQQR